MPGAAEGKLTLHFRQSLHVKEEENVRNFKVLCSMEKTYWPFRKLLWTFVTAPNTNYCQELIQGAGLSMEKIEDISDIRDRRTHSLPLFISFERFHVLLFRKVQDK